MLNNNTPTLSGFIFNPFTYIQSLHARTSSTNAVDDRDDNWNRRFHSRSNSSYKRDLRLFFIKPDLFVEHYEDHEKKADQATFGPILAIPQTNIDRKHLRIRIVNRGKGSATDCVCKFRITKWEGNTRHPSTELKTLIWEDKSKTKEIYPHGEEEVLNVIFADSDLRESVESGGILDIYAFVSTAEAYDTRVVRAQDGFGRGEFEAELSVKSKEGGYCKANLSIHIDSDHRNMRMKLSLFDKLILRFKRRTTIFRYISSLLRQQMRAYEGRRHS